MNAFKSVLLMLLGGIVQLSHANTPLVYTMQEVATIEEIQRCIGGMNYAGHLDLAARLVVEACGNATIDALWNVNAAIGRLGAWQYVLREKDGGRHVRLSEYCADGGFGTNIYVEVEDNTIVYPDKDMTPETFHDLVLSVVNRKGFPVRIYLLCRGNTIRDLLNAVELIDVHRLEADLKCEIWLLLGGEESKREYGNWDN